MGGHFACVGLSVTSGEEMARLMGPLSNAATWTDRDKGGRMGVWRDPSGVRIVFNTNKNGDIECCTPAFDGDCLQRVRPTGILKDKECRFCDMAYVEVLEDDKMVYPLALQVDDLGLTRERLPLKAAATMTITAFAEELQVWPDEAAYSASQTKEPKFASTAVIPSGLFGPEPHPHALMTGHVIKAALKKNQSTGGAFIQMVLKTFGGPYDALAPVDALPTPPKPGSVVQGNFWLVGRVVEGLLPPPPKKKRFGLF